jgi:hypothetical protein
MHGTKHRSTTYGPGKSTAADSLRRFVDDSLAAWEPTFAAMDDAWSTWSDWTAAATEAGSTRAPALAWPARLRVSGRLARRLRIGPPRAPQRTLRPLLLLFVRGRRRRPDRSTGRRAARSCR